MNFRIKQAEQELSEVDIRLVSRPPTNSTRSIENKSYTLRRYRQLVQ